MATRNFVPRKDGEGSIGKGRKQWNAVYADHINTLGRNRSYAVGDIAYSRHLPSWARLECVRAGTTGASEPNLASITKCGVMFMDGSVQWIVDDIRDCTPVFTIRGGLYLPDGYVKANGAEVLRTDYPRLIALADRYGLWTNEPDVDTGLIGRGNRATTMTLPNWTEKMMQFSATDVGNRLKPGLPNIKGDLVGTAYGFVTSRMADTQSPSSFLYTKRKTEAVFSGTGPDETVTIHADASRCSSIYGASDTVQPHAIKLLPIMRY